VVVSQKKDAPSFFCWKVPLKSLFSRYLGSHGEDYHVGGQGRGTGGTPGGASHDRSHRRRHGGTAGGAGASAGGVDRPGRRVGADDRGEGEAGGGVSALSGRLAELLHFEWLDPDPHSEYGSGSNFVLIAVLRIRIGFNADPDPAFYLYADSAPWSQNFNADPHPGHKKLEFGMKNILFVGNMS
jgi:hypothetical protein